jgi:cytochrome c-type biogenesis protein CcmH
MTAPKPMRLPFLLRGLPAALLVCLLAATAALAASPAPRTSLPEIEPQVMCVTCKIPLNVAESPQATREKAFIQSLIDKGEDEAQIKSALVAQYGPSVLSVPAAHGFDLTVYLVPLAVVLILLGAFVVLLPRWRRRAREQAAERTPPSPLTGADAARLDSDLARFD